MTLEIINFKPAGNFQFIILTLRDLNALCSQF